MIKQKVSIEHQIDDRLHQYFIPNESSLAECKLIIKEFEKYIDSRIDEAEKQREAQQEEAVNVKE